MRLPHLAMDFHLCSEMPFFAEDSEINISPIDIMTTLAPGTIQDLPIFEIVQDGYLLGYENETVFIQKRELKPNSAVGDIVQVFTFYNEERELEATTRLPNLQVGQIGCYRVSNSNALGSFITIGTRRDILIPHTEQIETLEDGRMALIILCEDSEGKRLFASTKLNRYLKNVDMNYERGDEVSLIIAEKIDIGRRVVVDGKFIGALFRQEMTDNVRLGEHVKGFVRKVEGKDITVSMQREGMELLEDSKEKLMNYLQLNGGYVRLTDDTDPEEIKLRLHMSKKAFKKAAGMLYKEGKVLLTKLGVKINKTGVVPDNWQKNKIFQDDGDTPPLKQERKSDDVEPKSLPVRNENKKFAPKEAEEKTISKPKAPYVKRNQDTPPSTTPPERNSPPKKELTFKGKK